MSITKGEFWTAFGVVVAAAGAAWLAGYTFGRDSASSEIANLKERVENERTVNGIDTSTFLQQIDVRSKEIGEKQALLSDIAERESKIASLEAEVQNLDLKLKEASEKLSKSENENKRLKSIISENFDSLEVLFAPFNRATFVIPGKFAVNASQTLNDSVYLTVTDSLDGGWVNLGEKVKLKYSDNNCYIIPIEIANGGVNFSFACEKPE